MNAGAGGSTGGVLAGGGGIGEGAVWDDRRQRLWWVEILECRLHCFDPVSGEDRIFAMPSYIGCLALRRDGGLVVALQDGFALFDPASGALETIGDHAPGRAGNRFNDGVVSPDGRFLATTMRAAPPFDQADQDLVVLDPDHRTRTIHTGLRIGNGLAFSNDGKTLFLADSHPDLRCIWAFDWDGETGTPGNRRLFYQASDIPGHPDGAAVDVDGGYWFASAYGWCVVRLDPTGRVDRVVAVPLQKPTKPAFGGAGLDTLFVTSIGTNLEPGSEERQPFAGGLYAIDAKVRGTPPCRYAG